MFGLGEATARLRRCRLEGSEPEICSPQLGLESSHLREASLVYLFWPEFSYTLKSWRKVRGLPSRGQRTWSNASGASLSLQAFKSTKSRLASLFFSEILLQDTSAALGAEQVNMYWLRQWGAEWLRGSISFSASKKKRRGRRGLDFDLGATSKGWVGNTGRSGLNLTKKKKKLLTGQVGFEPGFTKTYLSLRSGQPC